MAPYCTAVSRNATSDWFTIGAAPYRNHGRMVSRDERVVLFGSAWRLLWTMEARKRQSMPGGIAPPNKENVSPVKERRKRTVSMGGVKSPERRARVRFPADAAPQKCHSRDAAGVSEPDRPRAKRRAGAYPDA